VLRVLYKLQYILVKLCVLNGMVDSLWFHAVNGVKQGGVLSPVLFCIYLDGLLRTLCSSKIGCFVGTVFTGILAMGPPPCLSS